MHKPRNPYMSNDFRFYSIQGEPKFYTGKMWLTYYALSCGYIESYWADTRWCKTGDGHHVTLKLDCCYHVQGFNHRAGFKEDPNYWRVWESFDNINQARLFFKKMCREANARERSILKEKVA